MKWNKDTRNASLAKLDETQFDVVIIGGGITGAGILLDAVARGFKAVLIEKEDFASGTSSRSTKLIHGGLRYLKNFEFKIVRDTGRERAIAHKNAPHLVLPEKMLLPIQKKGTYGRFGTSIGLWIYDWLAGVQKGERRKMLSKEQTLLEEPLLRPDDLLGSGFYAEYRTDDARLTLEVIKTACFKGGEAINYCKAKAFQYDSSGQVNGVIIEDLEQSRTHTVMGSVIVNAAGPWSDELRTLDGSMNNKRLHLTKGVHIVFPRMCLPLNHSVYFDVNDGRMIFAIPRGGVTYVGTTDTDYKGTLEQPEVTSEDVHYLINAVNQNFPDVKLSQNEVMSTWVGLRPLIHEEGKSPSELSRKDELFLSPKGLITITGGKLTGYRLMAKKVVDLVAKRLDSSVLCTTDQIKINGFATVKDFHQLSERIQEHEQNEYMTSYLMHTYGSQAFEILSIKERVGLQTIIEAEAIYCIESEMTAHLLDFYVRRTGRMYFDLPSVSTTLDVIAKRFAEMLNWNSSTETAEIAAVQEEMKFRTNFRI